MPSSLHSFLSFLSAAGLVHPCVSMLKLLACNSNIRFRMPGLHPSFCFPPHSGLGAEGLHWVDAWVHALFDTSRLGYAGNQPSDPSYATATYAILDSQNFSLSRQLTLTILLETWPINTYPFLTLLPSGSTLIVAGERPFHCFCMRCSQKVFRA